MAQKTCCLMVPETIDGGEIKKKLVLPAINGIEMIDMDQVQSVEDVQEVVRKSDFVIVDISLSSTAVLYVIGYADALGKPVVCLQQEDFENRNLVDLGHRMVVRYNPGGDAETTFRRITELSQMVDNLKEKGAFSKPKHRVDMQTDICFVITRMGEEATESRKKSDACMDIVVGYVVKTCPGYKALRGDHTYAVDHIPDLVRENIAKCGFTIVNMFEPNENVAYELGYAHGLEKPVVLIREKGSEQEMTIGNGVIRWADWLWTLNCIEYNVEDTDEYVSCLSDIRMAIQAISHRIPKAMTTLSSEAIAEEARFKAFMEVFKRGSQEKIEEELMKIRSNVPYGVYLVKYLMKIAETNYDFAWRELIKGAKYVMACESFSFFEKMEFFDLLTEVIVQLPYSHRFLGISSTREQQMWIEKNIESVMAVLESKETNEVVSQIEKIIAASLLQIEGENSEENKELRKALGLRYYSMARLTYKSFLLCPWNTELLKTAVSWMENAVRWLESDARCEYALFHCVEWYLYLDTCKYLKFMKFIGVNDGDSRIYLDDARRCAEQLLHILEKKKESPEVLAMKADVLEKALKIYLQLSDEENANNVQECLEEVDYIQDSEKWKSDLPELPEPWIPFKAKFIAALRKCKNNDSIGAIFVIFLAIAIIITSSVLADKGWIDIPFSAQQPVDHHTWKETGDAMFYAVDSMLLTADTPVYTAPDFASAKTGEIEKAGVIRSGFYDDGDWFCWYTDAGTYYMPKEHAVPLFVQVEYGRNGMYADWTQVIPVAMVVNEGAKFYDSVEESGILGEVVRVLRDGHSVWYSNIEGAVRTSSGNYYYELWDGYVCEDDVLFLYARVSDLDAAGYDYSSNELYIHYAGRIGLALG